MVSKPQKKFKHSGDRPDKPLQRRADPVTPTTKKNPIAPMPYQKPSNKKFENFLISGTGRCGTRFLANLMNRSEIWTVFHEPGPSGINEYTTYDQMQMHTLRFEQDHYGEVNSMLRRIFLHINVAKRGILLRNPYDVYLSIINRKQNTDTKWMDEFKESLGLVDCALSTKSYKVKKIEFEKLITDVDYAEGILKWFGICDVKIKKEYLTTKVNYTKEENKKYKTIKDLPLDVRNEISIISERFLEKRKND